jgi:hypothetical protein
MRWSRHVSIPFLPGHGTLLYGTGPPMPQLVLACVCVALAIGAFVMGIVVLSLGLRLIMRAFGGKSPAKSDSMMPAQVAETGAAGPIEAAAPGAATTRASTRAAIAIILGGGLIWLGGEEV